MKFAVKIDHAGFTGTAEIDFPTKSEKNALLEEVRKLGFGAGLNAEDKALTEEKMKLVTRMGEIVEQRLVSVDVVFTETGTEIKEVGLLDIYAEGAKLSAVIANFILVGVQLGKPKNSTSAEQ